MVSCGPLSVYTILSDYYFRPFCSYESFEPSYLKPYLLLDPEDDKGVDFEFLSEAVRRFDEDDSIKPALIGAVEAMSRELAGMNVNDDYRPYVTVC